MPIRSNSYSNENYSAESVVNGSISDNERLDARDGCDQDNYNVSQLIYSKAQDVLTYMEQHPHTVLMRNNKLLNHYKRNLAALHATHQCGILITSILQLVLMIDIGPLITIINNILMFPFIWIVLLDYISFPRATNVKKIFQWLTMDISWYWSLIYATIVCEILFSIPWRYFFLMKSSLAYITLNSIITVSTYYLSEAPRWLGFEKHPIKAIKLLKNLSMVLFTTVAILKFIKIHSFSMFITQMSLAVVMTILVTHIKFYKSGRMILLVDEGSDEDRQNNIYNETHPRPTINELIEIRNILEMSLNISGIWLITTIVVYAATNSLSDLTVTTYLNIMQFSYDELVEVCYKFNDRLKILKENSMYSNIEEILNCHPIHFYLTKCFDITRNMSEQTYDKWTFGLTMIGNVSAIIMRFRKIENSI